MFWRTAIVVCLLTTQVKAAGFEPYSNSRFEFSIDLPADFKTVRTPDNGDGVGLRSLDGSAELSVWGNNITQGGFTSETDWRRDMQAGEGWRFTYERRGASWATFSGVRGRRIIYMRAIMLCDDAIANFSLEYPASEQRRYGPMVERLVKTLKGPSSCR